MTRKRTSQSHTEPQQEKERENEDDKPEWCHFIEPLCGPIFWKQSPYPPILPSDVRVLPGRPKRYRQKDASEIAEATTNITVEKAAKKNDGVFWASRKGSVIHCKICGALGHNARSCPRRSLLSTTSEGGSQPAPSSRRSKGKATISTSHPAPCTTTEEG
ncbi:hypothetical protein LIER_40434 [Lithospermum erythrorhizon]|uniref:CCHC-type domain-containing protein n=1 Tax=Lithospermum erythrorhizon TaxID=34254 RepID=A0AAV3QVP4_LITER